MEILSLQQINENIDTFIKDINGFNLKYSALFDTLNKFGFRVGEITSNDRWILTAFPIIEIVTEKGSNNRFIDIADFNFYVQEAINKNLFPFPYTSNSVASYFVTKYFPISPLYVKTKIITTHIFRHARIKNMSADGYTVEQISAFIGEKNDANTLGYINSVIMH